MGDWLEGKEGRVGSFGLIKAIGKESGTVHFIHTKGDKRKCRECRDTMILFLCRYFGVGGDS